MSKPKEDLRITNILKALSQYASNDFSQVLTVSKKGDELDAIAEAINKLSTTLKATNSSTKKPVTSEKQFQDILDHMLEGIQIHDFSWKYIYVNDALLKYSKYPREELIGYTVMEKYPGIEQTPLFKVMEKCMKERISEHLETEFVFPDGTMAHFELSIQPVPEGIFILSIDITERKKAEKIIKKANEELELKVTERTIQLEKKIQQLKESEEKFLKAFQTSAAGISITRLADSTYLDVNDAFTKLTGYTKEELIGSTSMQLGIIINIKKREEILQKIREQGSAKNIELTIKNKTGSILEILSSVETILLNEEKYAINIIYDITDRKRAEEQLHTVNHELEAFSYTVSHDLRAPLRSINGYAQILNEEYGKQLDEEAKRIIQVIRYNAAKMGMLIDDLLAFSRLGRKEIQKINVDMNQLVEGVIIEINKLPHKAEIRYGNLHQIEADYSLIHQVMYNLISNAVKYSSKKEKPLVEIASNESENEIVFEVKDNGAGFDMQYLNKLFGVFQRLHAQEEFEGTGVGLAIVQRVISKHGGKVWAEGKLNKGATFYFSILKN